MLCGGKEEQLNGKAKVHGILNASALVYLMLLFWLESYRVLFRFREGELGVMSVAVISDGNCGDGRSKNSHSTGLSSAQFGGPIWWLEACFSPWYYPVGKQFLLISW